MKKVITGMFLSILLVIISLSTNAAAKNIELKIDGVNISSDVEAEIKNNRTMVPLRVISENLGAKVDWADSTVTIAKKDMQVKLNLRSETILPNDKLLTLDVVPYVKQKRTMVPLRFLSETFGCVVNYKNATVTVDCAALVLDGVKVKALQYEYHMIMGGVIQQSRGNAYNEAVYNMFVNNLGNKVEAPENYSWQYTMDIVGSYYKQGQYDFLDGKGNSLKRFDIYYLVNSFSKEELAGYPTALIHDVTRNEWYLFSETASQSLDQLINKGFFEVISNTVV